MNDITNSEGDKKGIRQRYIGYIMWNTNIQTQKKQGSYCIAMHFTSIETIHCFVFKMSHTIQE